MKKAIALAYLLAHTAFAAVGNTPLPDQAHIAVSGSGSVTAAPDMARVELQLESLKKTSLAAKQSVDKQMNALLTELDKVALDKTRTQASDLLLEPNTVYDNQGRRSQQGYIASRRLTVYLEPVDLCCTNFVQPKRILGKARGV